MFIQEFLIRRFHTLFVDFIYYLPFKLKELRVQAEDTARMIEDCERARKPLPDNLQRDYEYFLELVRFAFLQKFLVELQRSFSALSVLCK